MSETHVVYQALRILIVQVPASIQILNTSYLSRPTFYPFHFSILFVSIYFLFLFVSLFSLQFHSSPVDIFFSSSHFQSVTMKFLTAVFAFAAVAMAYPAVDLNGELSSDASSEIRLGTHDANG